MENPITFLSKLNVKITRPSYASPSPESDWKIIFISTVVLVICVIILSIFVFIKIDKGEIFLTGGMIEKIEKPLDVSHLKETVNYYEGKRVEFERIKNSRVPSADPSI